MSGNTETIDEIKNPTEVPANPAVGKLIYYICSYVNIVYTPVYILYSHIICMYMIYKNSGFTACYVVKLSSKKRTS